MEQNQLEALVIEMRDMVRENNEILKKMQRNARIRFWVQIVFWVIIILVSVYGTYLLADQLIGALGGSGTDSSGNLQNLIQQYSQ